MWYKYSFLDKIIVSLESKKNSSAALMRINHSGEVCAQALYKGQALVTKDLELRNYLLQSASEEQYHMDWCALRVQELGGHKSYLNIIWGAGSFAIGIIAGVAGRNWGLGFVAETEQQVSQHLLDHLKKLPQGDLVSRSILKQMFADELKHRNNAKNMGAIDLPIYIKKIMKITSRVMTTVSRYW